MKPSAPRTFSSAGKVSHKSLVIAAALASVSALAFVARTKMEEAPAAAGVDAARQVLAATQAWQGDHSDGCPTISELIEDGRLDDKARVEDNWGNRFRIVCDGTRTSIHSAGPDRKAGTPDDVRIGRDDS
jgi:hypothetical protein